MPEACFETSPSSNLTNLNTTIATSIPYEHIEIERIASWNRSHSIDANCRGGQGTPDKASLRNVHEQVTRICKSRNSIISEESRRFCCCNNSSSCWKLKRRQIIRKSSQASAKNRTTEKAATEEEEEEEATAITTTKTKSPTIERLELIGGQPSAACGGASSPNTLRGGIVFRPAATALTTSTSLPATPNLSQFRRWGLAAAAPPTCVPYRKLSLDWSGGGGGGGSGGCGDDCATKTRSVQPQQQRQQQQQMSTTHLRPSYARVCAANGGEQQQQQQQQQLDEEEHLRSRLEAPLAAFKTSEELAAKFNNNNSNAINNNNNNQLATKCMPSPEDKGAVNGGRGGVSPSTPTASRLGTTSTISTQTIDGNQNNRHRHRHREESSDSTTTTTRVVKRGAQLACCENCSDSASVMSAASSRDNQRRADVEDVHCAHTIPDSVSELSSYRFVSDEEEAALETSKSATTTPTPCATNEPNGITARSTVTFSNATGTPATICCYTIDGGRRPPLPAPHYSATTTVVQYVTASAPLPIPIPPSTVGRDVPPPQEEVVLSSSLPRNYGSVAADATFGTRGKPLRRSTRSRIPAPPPVPPKPRSSAVHSGYDPQAFQRRVLKFEAPPPLERSPDRCEFLRCFAATVKNTRPVPRQVTRDDIATADGDGDGRFVARSLGERSCCDSLASDASEKCAINNHRNKQQLNNNNNNYNNNNNNNDNIYNNQNKRGAADERSPSSGGDQSPASTAASGRQCEASSNKNSSNNNYNCKRKVREQLLLQLQQHSPCASEPQLSPGDANTIAIGSTSIISPTASQPRRTLRYDSHGRLKSERVSQLPTPTPSYGSAQANGSYKAVSRDASLQHPAPTEIAQKFRFDYNRLQLPVADVADDLNELQDALRPLESFAYPLSVQYLGPHGSSISNSSKKISAASVTGSTPPTSPTTIFASDLAQQEGQQLQIFKSHSDSNNASCSNSAHHALKSRFPSSDSSIVCRCVCKQPTSPISPSSSSLQLKKNSHSLPSPSSPISPTSPTSPTSASLHLLQLKKNSHSLPSVESQSQSHGSNSSVWLSSETIGRCYSDQHDKCHEDTHSNCSDQTTIFHLDNECSLSASSSSPSSQSLGQSLLRGPLILRRIPVIQSFGYIPTHSGSMGSANVRDYAEKEINMEKRRNTLERFQRLGFQLGRKSSPSQSQVQSSSQSPAQPQQDSSSSSSCGAVASTTRNRKSAEKTERLKELTELLRGNRSSPTPPPVPPPRKPRTGTQSSSNSFEKQDTAASRTSGTSTAGDSTPLSFMSRHSDDIMLMDQEEQVSGGGGAETGPTTTAKATMRLYDTLKPNTSLSNFDSLTSDREKSKSPPPPPASALRLSPTTANTDVSASLARPESRTVIGSYTQKGIPYRSASFSQIDLTSGRYKKSALSTLRDRLRRDKAVDTTATSQSAKGHSSSGSSSDERMETAKVARVKAEPDWIYIPLKKAEMSINLNSGSLEPAKMCLADVMESPDMIPEEEIFTTDTEQTSSIGDDYSRVATAASIAVAHAKMESLTDTIHSENDYTIAEEQLPVSIGTSNMFEVHCPLEGARRQGTTMPTDILEPNLATLMEERMLLESPPDNFLQTATTCLIPVPVYECAAQEWRLENPPQEWVEVAPEEFGIIPETIEPLIALELCVSANAEVKTEPELRTIDQVPTISVSRSSEEADDKSILRRNDDLLLADEKETVERRQASLDYPEVKKRYSHDDMDLGKEKRSSLDGIATRLNAEERKRIDKSKRRKGMYIEHAEWTDHPGNAPLSRGLALDITIANFNAVKPESPEELGIMYINSPLTDDTRTPGSLYSFDLNTPESECSKPPVWAKAQRLTTFSCQSSEERDDGMSVVGGVGQGHTVGLPRNNKSYPFLCADSISDNESDRTPPPSRDRTSPSPALSDNDFKRFSKRPLRGPYGQMLEAEMKKPNKMHFEEILEDLRESEVPSQPRRQRAAHDDAGSRNVPQHSNSMRVRKTNTYLPVPAHARAASTPSQIENVNKGGVGKINPHEKRYQSSLDNSMCDKDYHHEATAPRSATIPTTANAAGDGGGAPQQATAKQSQSHQREMKRAASEAPMPKTHHSKRTQSMSGEKHATVQAKRGAESGAKGNTASASAPIKPTQELLAELLQGSSEKLISEQRQQMCADTRTHIVQEIFKMEQSYVESLQTVVSKYLKVLKSPEHAGMIDSRTVDEIFFMVPDILEIHQKFLAELKSRLDTWDAMQRVGDAFMETFSKLEVLEVYTSFVNNCNRAKNAIRSTKHQRPSFAKFLESTAREHKGKLTLDNLLIKPVQKFPNYEMLFQRLIKHTDHDHPDQKHLQDVLKLVHDILVHINCKEREILENGQREATLRELEGVIEGITDLIAPDRQFLLFDLVTMPSGQGARKERGFFLFNDLLVLTSIKKRSGTIRKPNTTTCPGTVASTLDTNKYKFLTKISLDCLEIVKTKDENVKRIMSEIENLADDCNKLQQIADITASLKYPHQYLEDVIRELHRDVQRQLSERQTNDAQLNMLELTVSSPNGSQKLTIVFSKAEKRTQWEETFNEAKQKLAATLERHPIPEFLTSIPIRKTRAGLQFTCAAPTLSEKRDVWVCNSDGYVGQVCIMSLHPEPNVTSCNGVCNARILCVASVPAYMPTMCSLSERPRSATPQHSYTQQLRDYRKSISPAATASASATATPEKKRSTASHAAAMIANSASTAVVATAVTDVASNNNGDVQLDLNLSSSDDEPDAAAAAAGSTSGSAERVPSPAPSTLTTASTSTASTAIVGGSGGQAYHAHQDSNPEEADGNQSTMWIGTEDGCIHVYNSTDNIRIKKNRIKIEHHSAVYSILYLDNRVFVSLANGDICVYLRDGSAVWNTSSSHCISMGTVSSPVTKLLNVHGKLWCSIQGIIKILDIESLLVVNQIQISSESKPITNMTVSNNYVWISIQNSAHIKCFHSISLQLVTEVNLAPAVNKMLSNCDEIIRQHKAACLRVTSLLSCKDLIWIGTSAGVLLTIPAHGYEKGAPNVAPTGIPHGHTGHVRFLTFVETASGGGAPSEMGSGAATTTHTAAKESDSGGGIEYKNQSSGKQQSTKTKNETNNILIISGGDGYEDFRNSGANSLSEIAGREDSTNHLLIWQI